MKKVFICGAWPYANNSLHIGHLAALLPGDVLARYFRQHGDQVLYVSGSDCHGTPITLRAGKLGVDPSYIAGHYAREFEKNFADLDFSYDNYSATMTEYHKNSVEKILKKIYDNGYIYEKEEDLDYCEKCGKFVSDREISGTCPVCGSIATGDQCDNCLTALTPDMLLDKKCKTCGSSTSLKKDKNLYFKLTAFEKDLEDNIDKNCGMWRTTAINESKKYIKSGLRDRSLTRNLTWGVKVPFEGYDDKRIYVWFEAVLGYFTAGRQVAESKGIDFDSFIRDPETEHFYIHGKDNIVFHTIILPSLLCAIDKSIGLPNRIVSCEYVNLNNEKMSKSKGNLISVNNLVKNLDSDVIRYFFTLFNPERKDASFQLKDLVDINNKHLVGGWGNFINRNLSFLIKKFEGVLPNTAVDPAVVEAVEAEYEKVGALYEANELRAVAEEMYAFVQYANRYYDESKPWVLAKEDKAGFDKVTATCLYLIVNIANMYMPIMPKTSKKVFELLGVNENKWGEVNYDSSIKLSEVSVLFTKLEEKNFDFENAFVDTLVVPGNN